MDIRHHALNGHPRLLERFTAVPMASPCVSVVADAERRLDFARRPKAMRMNDLIGEFLRRVAVLPCDSSCTAHYGVLHAQLGDQGKTLATLDLIIAATALAIGAVLVAMSAPSAIESNSFARTGRHDARERPGVDIPHACSIRWVAWRTCTAQFPAPRTPSSERGLSIDVL